MSVFETVCSVLEDRTGADVIRETARECARGGSISVPELQRLLPEYDYKLIYYVVRQMYREGELECTGTVVLRRGVWARKYEKGANMGRGPALIKSVAIGQRWRRKSTSIVYSVYQVWRKDRLVRLIPLPGQGADEDARVTVKDLKKLWEPVDMYIPSELLQKEDE